MTVRDIDLNKRADELSTDEVNKIATVLNNSCQFKISTHMLNRNKSARDITVFYDVRSKELEMQAEAERRKLAENLQSEGDQQSEINKIGTVLNNSYQFKIPAHNLNRNRSSQDITEVFDVTSKESFNEVET